MPHAGKSIVIASSYYLPHLGGVEQYTLNLAQHLARQGIRVFILTCNIDSSMAVESDTYGITVCRIPTHNLHNRFPLPARTFRTSPGWQTIEQSSFDAMIVNTRFYPLSLHALALAQKHGVQSVVVEHGSNYLSVGNAVSDTVLRAYEHHITQRVRTFSPRFYGVSQRACQWLENFGIAPAGTIPNAIDAQEFRSCASNRNFREEFGIAPHTALAVYAGRLIKEKGTRTLLATAHLLYENNRTLQFFVAGEGPEQTYLEQHAPPNLTLLGRTSRTDLAALLLQADIFCFPSRYPEGLPSVLLEAAACGTYIVTTAVGGSSEVLTNEPYGTLLSDARPDYLCCAIEDYLAHIETCKQKAHLCQKHVEQSLSWEKSAQAALKACLLD